jgi:hypothetical protein
MSRTKKGSKPAGYEYWSRRPPSNQHGSPPGKVGKQITHERERAAERRLILDEKDHQESLATPDPTDEP